MADTINVYTLGAEKIHENSIDFLNDTIKVMLLDTGYTPAQNTDEFVSDIVADEETDGSYSRQTLGSKTITQSGNIVKIDGGDITYSSLTSTNSKYAVVFKDSGADATSPLICYVTFDSSTSSGGNDLVIEWSADGIYKDTTS